MNPFTHAHSFETASFYICSVVYVPETFEECWWITPHKHILFIRGGLSLLFLEAWLDNKHFFNKLRHRGRVGFYYTTV